MDIRELHDLARTLSEYGYTSEDLTKEDAENELFREFTDEEFEALNNELFSWEIYTVYGIR